MRAVNPQPFGLHSAYPPFVLLGLLTSVVVLALGARRDGIPLGRLLLAHTVLCFAFLVGALTYNMIEAGASSRFDWSQLFGSGLRYPGGIIGGLLALPLVRFLLPAGLSALGYLDLVAPAIAFAMVVVRIGCFLMGCCYGLRSSLPWAVSFAPGSQAARHHVMNGWIEPESWSLPVHPLQMYFALASLSVGVILLWFQRRKSYAGQVVLLGLVLDQGSKGLLEFLRGSIPSHSVTHLRVASLSMAGIATLLLVARARGWIGARTVR